MYFIVSNFWHNMQIVSHFRIPIKQDFQSFLVFKKRFILDVRPGPKSTFDTDQKV